VEEGAGVLVTTGGGFSNREFLRSGTGIIEFTGGGMYALPDLFSGNLSTLGVQDRWIKTQPELAQVSGKPGRVAGRARVPQMSTRRRNG
jgi:hypothetical protein